MSAKSFLECFLSNDQITAACLQDSAHFYLAKVRFIYAKAFPRGGKVDVVGLAADRVCPQPASVCKFSFTKLRLR